MKIYMVMAVVEDFFDIFRRNVACYDSRPAAERHAIEAAAASAAIFKMFGSADPLLPPPDAGSDEWVSRVQANTLDPGIYPGFLYQYEVQEFEVRTS